jgi:hypothetical protein
MLERVATEGRPITTKWSADDELLLHVLAIVNDIAELCRLLPISHDIALQLVDRGRGRPRSRQRSESDVSMQQLTCRTVSCYLDG